MHSDKKISTYFDALRKEAVDLYHSFTQNTFRIFSRHDFDYYVIKNF